LSGAGDVITDQLSVIGRSSAVLAVSGGLIATLGLADDVPHASTLSVRILDASLGTAPIEPSEAGLLALRAATAAGHGTAAPAATLRPTVASRPVVAATGKARSTDNRFADNRSAGNPSLDDPSADDRSTNARSATARSTETGSTRARSTSTRATKTRSTKLRSSKTRSTRTRFTGSRAKASTPVSRSTHTTPPSAPTRKAFMRRTVTPPKITPPAKPYAPPRHQQHVEVAAKEPPATRPARPGVQQRAAVRGSAVLAVAVRYLGTPYLYGGSSPRGFDCSGYTGHVFRQLGIALPRTAHQQMRATRRISRSQARPGDLVFFVSAGRAYHVGIYAGGGKMYDAPRPGRTVGKRAIWDAAVVYGRVIR
jgi:cell wall-associated NlpC family hydrolase